MSFADDILSKLFPARRESDSTLLKRIDAGQIKRSKEEQMAYQAWVVESEKHILHELRQHAMLSRKNLGNDLGFIWLDQNSAKGFRVNTTPFRSALPEAWHLLDLLKERICAMDYVAQNKEYEVVERDGEVHQREWYYLKPSYRTRLDGPPFPQLFGNIHLELKKGSAPTLRLLATTYPDRSFQDPKPFDDLIDALFDGLSS